MGATFHAQGSNQLPDIGTAGVAALPIEQEVRYGNAFMRFARAGLPIIDDPVLNEYIDDLGQRLLTNADGVRFPFTFFLINDPSINAAAFLGGRSRCTPASSSTPRARASWPRYWPTKSPT